MGEGEGGGWETHLLVPLSTAKSLSNQRAKTEKIMVLAQFHSAANCKQVFLLTAAETFDKVQAYFTG